MEVTPEMQAAFAQFLKSQTSGTAQAPNNAPAETQKPRWELGAITDMLGVVGMVLGSKGRPLHSCAMTVSSLDRSMRMFTGGKMSVDQLLGSLQDRFSNGELKDLSGAMSQHEGEIKAELNKQQSATPLGQVFQEFKALIETVAHNINRTLGPKVTETLEGTTSALRSFKARIDKDGPSRN